jgi:hypothetical protein
MAKLSLLLLLVPGLALADKTPAAPPKATGIANHVTLKGSYSQDTTHVAAKVVVPVRALLKNGMTAQQLKTGVQGAVVPMPFAQKDAATAQVVGHGRSARLEVTIPATYGSQQLWTGVDMPLQLTLKDGTTTMLRLPSSSRRLTIDDREFRVGIARSNLDQSIATRNQISSDLAAQQNVLKSSPAGSPEAIKAQKLLQVDQQNLPIAEQSVQHETANVQKAAQDAKPYDVPTH